MSRPTCAGYPITAIRRRGRTAWQCARCRGAHQACLGGRGGRAIDSLLRRLSRRLLTLLACPDLVGMRACGQHLIVLLFVHLVRGVRRAPTVGCGDGGLIAALLRASGKVSLKLMLPANRLQHQPCRAQPWPNATGAPTGTLRQRSAPGSLVRKRTPAQLHNLYLCQLASTTLRVQLRAV